MSASAPSTPLQTIPSNAPTGTWQHPQFDQIQQRMQATRFDDRNIRTVLWNALFLIITFLIPTLESLKAIHPGMAALTNNIAPYTSYTLYVLRLIPAAGIFHALYPLWKRRNDDLSDIPLTPSQRSLLGLEPSTKPDSPAIGNYVTPPRYARSVTPSSNRSNSGSPFSGRDSVGSGIGNTYSPTASPLLHKAIGREARRQSLGASTSLQYPRALNEPSTALAIGSGSPGGIRSNASVGLNNRWLYEKGRNSPKSTTRGVYT